MVTAKGPNTYDGLTGEDKTLPLERSVSVKKVTRLATFCELDLS